MDNANSPDYLEKIKIQVIENLKKTAAVPSVQMTDVPRGSMLEGYDSDADDAADDEDQDMNADVRHTQRDFDRRITRDDEFEESEDEEMNQQNGVRRQPGKGRRRGIMDFQNPNAAPDFNEPESGMGSRLATPSPGMRSRSRTGSVNGDVTMGDGSREENAAISQSKADRALKVAQGSPAPGLAGDADQDVDDAADESDEEDERADGEAKVTNVKDEDGDVDMAAADETAPSSAEELAAGDTSGAPDTLSVPTAEASTRASTRASANGTPAPAATAEASNTLAETTPPASPPAPVVAIASTSPDPGNVPVDPEASQPGTQPTADTKDLPVEDVEMMEGEPAIEKEKGLAERQEQDESAEAAKVAEERKES